MNYLWAFVVGGAICVVGQLLIDYTSLTPARILTGYVVSGVILSAVGLYKPLVDLAGAGASVTIAGVWASAGPGGQAGGGYVRITRHIYRRFDGCGRGHRGQHPVWVVGGAYRQKQGPELNKMKMPAGNPPTGIVHAINY